MKLTALRPPKESAIQTGILRYLALQSGVWVVDDVRRLEHLWPEIERARRPGAILWRQNTGAAYLPGRGGKPRPVRFGLAGAADISGLISPWGVRLEIEVKRPGGKVSPEQLEFHRMVGAFGGVAFVAHDGPEAWADLCRSIDTLRRDRPT